MVSPTQLCWRYHSLPLRQRYVVVCSLSSSPIKAYLKLNSPRYLRGTICLTLIQKRYDAWWRHQIETFSALLDLCVGNSPVTGEFPAQRPVTRSLDGFFDLRLNEPLSKQWWGWWFETPSRSLLHLCNCLYMVQIIHAIHQDSNQFHQYTNIPITIVQVSTYDIVMSWTIFCMHKYVFVFLKIVSCISRVISISSILYRKHINENVSS